LFQYIQLFITILLIGKMDSKEEHSNKELSTGLEENGHNDCVRQVLLDDFHYYVSDDIVEGMHLALGKTHHAYQMNV
jgi:hypothetical protein